MKHSESEIIKALNVIKDVCTGRDCFDCKLIDGNGCCMINEIAPSHWDINEYWQLLKNSKDNQNTDNEKDMVNHPSHYTHGKFECIDVLEDITKDLTGIEAICTANAVKYLWRWKHKNGVEDLKKARWYLDKLIQVIE